MKHANTRVFFANFPYTYQQDDVARCLEQVGKLSHIEVFLSEHGASRGCGLAEYCSSVAAQEAVKRLNSTRVSGRMITIKLDESMRNRPPSPKIHVLTVKNIPSSVTWQQLKDVFREVGPVARADISIDRQGRSTGTGTVCFEKLEDAQEAVRVLDGAFFNSNRVSVSLESSSR